MTWTTDLEAEPLIGLLNAHGVDFVVIGGIAAVLHGSARITKDLDVVFAPDGANLRLLGRALTELNARLRGVDDPVPFVPDEKALRNVRLLTLDTDHGPLDVMVEPDGRPSYEQLRRRAERMEVGAFGVLVASIPDLIAMKRAAGRHQDLADVETLEAIQRLRR
jgi:nucleotidyltransferase AbiEii toxin of type IV toxin-antitoxin system